MARAEKPARGEPFFISDGGHITRRSIVALRRNHAPSYTNMNLLRNANIGCTLILLFDLEATDEQPKVEEN